MPRAAGTDRLVPKWPRHANVVHEPHHILIPYRPGVLCVTVVGMRRDVKVVGAKWVILMEARPFQPKLEGSHIAPMRRGGGDVSGDRVGVYTRARKGGFAGK